MADDWGGFLDCAFIVLLLYHLPNGCYALTFCPRCLFCYALIEFLSFPPAVGQVDKNTCPKRENSRSAELGLCISQGGGQRLRSLTPAPAPRPGDGHHGSHEAQRLCFLAATVRGGSDLLLGASAPAATGYHETFPFPFPFSSFPFLAFPVPASGESPVGA